MAGNEIRFRVGDEGIFHQIKQDPALAYIQGAYPRQYGLCGPFFPSHDMVSEEGKGCVVKKQTANSAHPSSIFEDFYNIRERSSGLLRER